MGTILRCTLRRTVIVQPHKPRSVIMKTTQLKDEDRMLLEASKQTGVPPETLAILCLLKNYGTKRAFKTLLEDAVSPMQFPQPHPAATS